MTLLASPGLRWSILAAVRLFVGLTGPMWASPLAQAHDAAPNSAFLSKSNSTALHVRFTLDPGLLLYKTLGAGVDFERFLLAYTEMPPAEFAANLAKAQAQFAREVMINAPDGQRLALRQWSWPPASQWQDPMRMQLVILKTKLNDLGHAPPLEVNVEAISTRPIAQLQLSLPKSAMPIQVNVAPKDQFWLTDKIPSELIQF